MKISICDDEKNQRLALRKVLEQKLQLEGLVYKIEEYDSGEKLLAGLKAEAPDILFLDIEMSGINGMEAAKELRKTCHSTVLIFVTAYPDFVFQGYEVHAFHYILKPYREEKIREVLMAALSELGTKEVQFYLVEQKAGSLKLPLKEVYFFKSDRKKIEVFMAGGKEEFYGKISELESKLPDYFVRSHNRYLINIHYVTKLENSVCVCAEETVPVSRAYRHTVAVAFARAMLQ